MRSTRFWVIRLMPSLLASPSNPLSYLLFLLYHNTILVPQIALFYLHSRVLHVPLSLLNLLIFLPANFSFSCHLSLYQQLLRAWYVPGMMHRTFLQEAFLNPSPRLGWTPLLCASIATCLPLSEHLPTTSNFSLY